MYQSYDNMAEQINFEFHFEKTIDANPDYTNSLEHTDKLIQMIYDACEFNDESMEIFEEILCEKDKQKLLIIDLAVKLCQITNCYSVEELEHLEYSINSKDNLEILEACRLAKIKQLKSKCNCYIKEV